MPITFAPTLRPVTALVALLASLSAPVLLAGAEPASAASSNGEWASLGNAGGWRIDANDVVCMSTRAFQNGTNLHFIIAANEHAGIMISNDRWAIPEGNYPVTLSVDRTPPVVFPGKADRTIVSVSWKLSADEINLVSYGATLHVTVGRTQYHYSLAGSADMLASLGRCAGDRMALANPFSGTQPTTPTQPYQPAIINPFAGN
jgi:hypothetical protein